MHIFFAVPSCVDYWTLFEVYFIWRDLSSKLLHYIRSFSYPLQGLSRLASYHMQKFMFVLGLTFSSWMYWAYDHPSALYFMEVTSKETVSYNDMYPSLVDLSYVHRSSTWYVRRHASVVGPQTWNISLQQQWQRQSTLQPHLKLCIKRSIQSFKS